MAAKLRASAFFLAISSMPGKWLSFCSSEGKGQR